MTIYDLFKEAIRQGVAHDFRPKEEVLNFEWKETVRNADGDSFINPYSDSGVVWAESLALPVHRVAVGIDIEESELLGVREWEKETDKKVDLFIGHHSEGRPMTSFPIVLKTQLGNLKSEGIDIKALDPFFNKRIDEIALDTLSDNFNRVRDMAALLKCNYLSLHSPIDNLSARFVESLIVGHRPQTLGECRDLLLSLPEYADLKKYNQIEPQIVVGEPDEPLGKFLLTEFVGGEEGPLEVYEAMRRAGIKTLISMHMSPEALGKLQQQHINVIAAGHLGSDSIGLNVFSDYLLSQGIEVIPIGGFVRCVRTEKESILLTGSS